MAAVKRGVCGSCHLAFPSGSLASLRRTNEALNVCVNCGAFVYLAEEEPASGSANAVADIRKKGSIETGRCSSPSTDPSPQSPRGNMTKTSLSLHEAEAKGCDCKTDRGDLVRTLRDLTGLELDSSNRTPKLEFARLTLRQKLPPNVLAIHDKLIAEGKDPASHLVLRTRARSARARLPSGRTQSDSLKCSSNVPHCGTLLYG